MEPLKPRLPDYAVRLRERDLRVLSYIATNQFAPIKILRALFWSDAKTHADYRRLRQLSALGLVETLSSGRTFSLCYRLTEKGVRVTAERGKMPLSNSRPIRNYGTSFEHDKHLQYIRQILEQEPCIANYHSETEVRTLLAERHGFQKIRDERYKVPDAMFTLRLSEKTLTVALELELSAKSSGRTTRMMELLGTSSDFDSTFFVVGDDNLRLRLVRAVDDARKANSKTKPHGFYFTSLSELLNNKNTAVFVGEGTMFTLKQLTQTHKQTSK